MAFKGYAKIEGIWRDLTSSGYVKVNGVWRKFVLDNLRQWYKIEGQWRTLDDDGGTLPPPIGPVPGTYYLNPTSQYLPVSGSGYAEFNTAAYRGFITVVQVQIAWGNFFFQPGSPSVFSASGRASGTFYRNFTLEKSEWANRTILHGISSFNASAITQFNNGSAIGFNYSDPSLSGLDQLVRNTRLVLTVS